MSAEAPNDWLLADELAPATGGTMAAFYAAASAGSLELPFCERCDLPLELEQRVCDSCASETIVWRIVEPAGLVHSVTTVFRREPGLVLTGEPYLVVDVELVSGHRLVMSTVHSTKGGLAIGDPVQIGFRRLGGVALPAVVVERTREV